MDMKDEIIKFKKRWAIANAAEIRELRASSLSEKARQTAALMESAKKLGWTELHDPEEKQVRERWNALRKKQGK
jgi:hypothetical protein